jgi:hypothetical protein
MAAVSRTDILSSDTAISWRAVAAGAAAALALTLVLLAIGSAVGFSSVSPWANSGVSATTFEIGSGIYLVVMAMISSTIGGYIAGRLRSKWTGVHNYEVQFRDTAHGFLAWAVATILGAAFLASASTFLAAGVATGAPARVRARPPGRNATTPQPIPSASCSARPQVLRRLRLPGPRRRLPVGPAAARMAPRMPAAACRTPTARPS